MQLSKI